jgi:hypothetical protein
MTDRVWHVGDYVEVECPDGAVFQGILQDIQDHYVLVNGYGYAAEGLKMRPVPR